MHSVKADILNCLKNVKGSGKFVSTQTDKFVFPGLEIEGLGELSYPINGLQAKALIQTAHKAPFGKGSDTILDNTVRSAWEIDAAQLSFKGAQWSGFMDKLLGEIKEGLGLEDYTISASLYKMLIYETGDFFLPHKDSEKEKGMFGTLVVGLPSQYTGGELVVRFDGVEQTVDLSEAAGEYEIGSVAFYADCDHEIKPLTSGYRVCLVYNLVQQAAGKEIKYEGATGYARQLATVLKNSAEAIEQPLIVLLGHQYTPDGFAEDALKLNDRPKAAALFMAAKMAGCYAKLCLVTAFRSGSPAYGGYHEDDPNAEMDEVHDESLYIEHWLQNEFPVLSNVPFEEEDLIASFTIENEEPVIKESTGYMGNYGPDLEHWYHYGAVMVWTKEQNAQLLLMQSTQCQLDWIEYFCENPGSISDAETASVNFILSRQPDNTRADKEANYNAVASWVVLQKDYSFFQRISIDALLLYFAQTDIPNWQRLFSFLQSAAIQQLLERVAENANTKVMEQLIVLLQTLSANAAHTEITVAHIAKLPLYLQAFTQRQKSTNPSVNTPALKALFLVSEQEQITGDWRNAIVQILTGHGNKHYYNMALVPALLAVEKPNELTRQLLAAARHYFQQIADNQPQPPANWARPVPESSRYKATWAILKPFLESAEQEVFDYRKAQMERSEMENAIRHEVMDLAMETIKKGTPHTLRLTKTKATYHRAMNEWKDDMAMLNKIVDKMEGVSF